MIEKLALKRQDSTLKTLLNTACPPKKYAWMGVMQITEKLSSHVFSKLASIYHIQFAIA